MEEQVKDTQITPKQRRRMAAQRRRTHNVILAGVFLLLILVFFLGNLISKDRTFSEAENRNLAQMPTFSTASLLDGSYFSGLTDYFSDQFLLRDRWLSLKLWADKRLGKQESGGVYLGKDHYLLSPPEEPDQAALAETIEAMNQFAARHEDLNITMLLVPGAAAILPEDLPKNAPTRDQLADIDALRQQLSAKVQFVDVSQTLLSHVEEYIYYRTDHHWTSLGARYAFETAAPDLGLNVPDGYDVYTVTTDFEGTLSSRSGSHSATDTIDVYTPQGMDVPYYVTYPDGERICSLYRSEALDTKDKYTVFFGGNHSLLTISTTANNDRKLLVFKDSYANCFMQFLAPYYETILMVDPRYYYDNVESVMTQNGVTDVLFLYSADTFLTDTVLADVLSAESVTEPAEVPAITEPEDSTEESFAVEPESSAEESEAFVEEPDSTEESAQP